MSYLNTPTADAKPLDSPAVSPQTPQYDQNGNPVVAMEQSFEYRDQEGNQLDPEQVEKLRQEGIEFETRHEVKTRLIDEEGNEVVAEGGVHPQHPDAEGLNPNTAGIEKKDKQAEREANDKPANVDAGVDTKRQAEVDGKGNKKSGQAQPGSERAEAT